MAYRLWKQITGVKFLKNGSLHTCLNDRSTLLLGKKARNSSLSYRNTSTQSKGGSGPRGIFVLEYGRFVTNAPGVARPEELFLRKNVRDRIVSVKHVSKQADHYNKILDAESKAYTPISNTEPSLTNEQVKVLKDYSTRKILEKRYQPQDALPFNSIATVNQIPEQVRSRNILYVSNSPLGYGNLEVKLADKETDDEEAEKQSTTSEDSVISDVIHSDVISQKSQFSIPEVIPGNLKDFNTTVAEVEPQVIETEVAIPPPEPGQGIVGGVKAVISDWSRRSGITSSKKDDGPGYGFAKMDPQRKYSTFTHHVGSKPWIQTRNYSGKRPMNTKDKCKKKKSKKQMQILKDCTKDRDPTNVKVYKHEGRWTACECCPEMLPCDQTECYVEYEFPCPCEDMPSMCPIDCPPPCENLPPPLIPLPRPKGIPRYQKVKDKCKKTCPKPTRLLCVEKKTLPPIKSDCFCVEPKPLKHVRLVRLPPICVCPNPPNPKCIVEPCPMRADEVCKWQYPKKKLKNFWCPNCPVPVTKYKWCKCHTRGMKECKEVSKHFALFKCDGKSKISRQVRHLSTFRKRKTILSHAGPSASNGTPSCSLKPFTSQSYNGVLAQRAPGVLVQSVRKFYLSSQLTVKDERGKKEKYPEGNYKLKQCPAPFCPKFPDPCCPPKARVTCARQNEELCCTKQESPYPSFSECSEFHETLTCECGKTQPYLQPRNQATPIVQNILPPTPPFWSVVDPSLEEDCVLHDLCRPRGYTYNCETFHRGEVHPLTQYECMSPHRLPCCERDQICDMERASAPKTCTGDTKGRTFYRCECACDIKEEKCDKKKVHQLDCLYDQIRKNTKREYSTYAGANRFGGVINATTKPAVNKIICRQKHDARAGGEDDYWVKCKCTAKKEKCKQEWVGSVVPKRDSKRSKYADSNGIGRTIKDYLSHPNACDSDRQKSKKDLERLQCQAKQHNMKLVRGEKSCCRKKPKPCKIDGTVASSPGAGCPEIDEVRRPKNVCETCIPRYEANQCRPANLTAPCCVMPPLKMTGEEMRAMMPECCKMPIPDCNRSCMRVRAKCVKETLAPCCVIESPYPAFSDCRPPFKRLSRSECQWKEFLEERSKAKIHAMTSQFKAPQRKFCTSAVQLKDMTILDKMLSWVDSKQGQKSLECGKNCQCSVCHEQKAQNIKMTLPNDPNIPAGLFSKDDLFKEVDKENLISLKPDNLIAAVNANCYLFNNPKKPAKDAKPAADEKKETAAKQGDDSKSSEIKAKVQGRQTIKIIKPEPEPTTLSSTKDVYYINEGKTFNLCPKINATKVKVVEHPLCTHIMLDSGELLLEREYFMMQTIMPMKNRMYIPNGLLYEEYLEKEKEENEKVTERLEAIAEELNESSDDNSH